MWTEEQISQIGIMIILGIEISFCCAFFAKNKKDIFYFSVLSWCSVIFLGVFASIVSYPYIGWQLIFIIFPMFIIIDDWSKYILSEPQPQETCEE
jgi:hypothetical protein